MSGVSYIPCAEDDLSTQTRVLKDKAGNQGPTQLLSNDAWLLTKNLSLCGGLFCPLRLETPLPGVDSNGWRIFLDYCIIGILSLLQIPLVFAAFPAFLILPGWVFATGAAVGCGLVAATARLTWGDILVESRLQKFNGKHKDEKWVFFNGVTTR